MRTIIKTTCVDHKLIDILSVVVAVTISQVAIYSRRGTEQYWRSTANYAGAVLAEPWHDNAIQY